jgi:hypothetical protein
MRNHGLTLVLLALCGLSLFGHLLAGHRTYNSDQRRHGEPESTLGEYAASPHFQESVAENCESEFLQMLAFVMLTTFLFQRGSPESKEPGEVEEVDQDPRTAPITDKTPWPVRRGGWVLKLYEHSLGLAFLLLFLASIAWHALSGVRLYNEERSEHGEPPESTRAYLTSSDFWFESFQNWQSEFLSVAAMVFLSVYLRQRGSPESKRVAAGHDEHE